VADRVEIHIIFEMVHPQHGTYRDALIWPLEDYAHLTKPEIQAAKQQRFDNWVHAIENPPVPDPVEPTTALDDAQARLAELADQINTIAATAQDAVAQAAQAVADTIASTDAVSVDVQAP
jgi:esterase/lipase